MKGLSLGRTGQEVERSGTVSLDGEDRPVGVQPTTKASGSARTVEVPYDVDDDTLFFETDVVSDSEYAESTDECPAGRGLKMVPPDVPIERERT